MSLETWAKNKGTKILAVAADNDWKRFCQISEYIDLVEDLAEGIAIFQPRPSSADFCLLLGKSLVNKSPDQIYQEISRLLAERVGELDLEPEVSTPFDYENDYLEISLKEFEFLADEAGNAILLPVQGQDDILVIEAKVQITATASTIFYLSVRDSVDKDYVLLGNSDVSVDLKFESELLLTFKGKFDQGFENVELIKFELLSYPSEVDFGYIDLSSDHDEN